MKTAAQKEKTKKVNFTLFAPQAQSIYLAGDFNDWDRSSHPMKKDKKGTWKASLNLAPGTYQYRFLVDGEWQSNPECEECVPNPFGTLNCIKNVE